MPLKRADVNVFFPHCRDVDLGRVLSGGLLCRHGSPLQDAQQDAANLLATIKLQSNPENTVGVLTTAGSSSRILITSTQDTGKILTCLRSVAPTGTADVVAAMQKAQLALKHRQNQAQRQRIVLFVGSPIAAEEAVLVSLGKKLKKNAVAVDVINFGESVENEEKLNAFIGAVNSDENSHLLSVASGTAILADAIMPSPIVSDNGGGGGGGSGGGGSSEAFPFGVDPSVDPELAMVLRLSMEEEEARRAAASASEGGGASAAGDAAAGTADTPSTAAAGAAAASVDGAAAGGPIAGADEAGGASDDAELYDSGDAEMDVDAEVGDDDGEDEEGDDTEDAEADMLVQALAASNEEAAQGGGGDEDMDEDLRRAIELSKEEYDGGDAASGGADGGGDSGGKPDGSAGSA